MPAMMIFLIILCVIILLLISAALLRSSWEQKHFIVRDYTLRAEGLRGSFKAAVIADLHGAVYGKNNEKLIRAVDEAAPDLVLIPGDLITCRRGADAAEAPDLSLLRALASRYPVYYAPGNHEENYLQLHPEYAREVADTGAVFLMNEIVTADIPADPRTGPVGNISSHPRKGSPVKSPEKEPGKSPEERPEKEPGKSPEDRPAEKKAGVRIHIAGLAIGEDYYVRGKQPRMSVEFLEDRLGLCPEGYTILLAHNPGYFPVYAQWGEDCVFSGHNHGGVIHLPLLGGVISASLRLFDRYDRGVFREGKSTMVLSAGLGMHTIHVRLFNRPELVTVSVQGDS